MTKRILLIVFILFFYSCKEQKALDIFDLNCPKIYTDQEYKHYDNKFSISIPRSWCNNSKKPIEDSSIVNVLFVNDSIDDVTNDRKLIRLHLIGITSYMSKEQDLEQEYKKSVNEFTNEFKKVKILSKGSTNFLKYDSYFIEYTENTTEGDFYSITFLLQSDYDKNEYFILNSTFTGFYEPKYEICQHENILKSFQFEKK